jgi:hypothetical protein
MSTTDSPSTVDAAKEQAAGVGQRAGAAAGDVASTAKEQASEVVSEANAQVKQLGRQLKTEVGDQANAQRDRLVELLNSASDELWQMADRSEAPGVVTDVARSLAQRTRSAANYLQDREPEEMVQGLTDFARRRAGMFLAGSALAGLLAGRVTRGVVANKQDDTSSRNDYPDAQYAGSGGAYGGYPGTVEPAMPYGAAPAMGTPVIDGPPPAAGYQTYPDSPPAYETYPDPVAPQGYPDSTTTQQAYPDTAEIDRDLLGRDGRE